jgi:hypothetical protein
MDPEKMDSEKSKLAVAPSDADGSKEVGAAVDSNAADADEAMKAFETIQREHLHLDTATSKRLLRKIDMVLMPVRATLHLSPAHTITDKC